MRTLLLFLFKEYFIFITILGWVILVFKPWKFYMIIFSSLEKRCSVVSQYKVTDRATPEHWLSLCLLWIVGKAKFLVRRGLTLFLDMGDFPCVGGRRRLLGGRCLYHKSWKISKEALSLSSEIKIHPNTLKIRLQVWKAIISAHGRSFKDAIVPDTS